MLSEDKSLIIQWLRMFTFVGKTVSIIFFVRVQNPNYQKEIQEPEDICLSGDLYYRTLN